jgi:hypothetical protein
VKQPVAWVFCPRTVVERRKINERKGVSFELVSGLINYSAV